MGGLETKGAGTGWRLPQGRPAMLDEPWRKVTVVLFERQIVFLDRLSADIRARTKAPIKRTELIRALIDALEQSEVDVTTADSEANVRRMLTARLKR